MTDRVIALIWGFLSIVLMYLFVIASFIFVGGD